MKILSLCKRILIISLFGLPLLGFAQGKSKSKSKSKGSYTRIAKNDKSAGEKLAPEKSRQIFLIDPSLSTVTLRLTHSVLGRFDTVGRNALRGTIEVDQDSKSLRSSSVEFMVDQLSSLIGLRDKHMKEDFLESKKFPLVFMKDSVSKLLSGPTSTAPSQSFEGRLWVKQIEGRIKGESRLRIEDELLVGSIEFEGKLSTFSITPPTYMGVGVKDDLKVLVELTCRPDLSDLATPDLNATDF